MTVLQLTEQQKDELVGVEYAPNSLFNPVQDGEGVWILSTQEADQCNLQWVKDLPQIVFIPKVEKFI